MKENESDFLHFLSPGLYSVLVGGWIDTIHGCMLSMGQLKCGLEVKDATALNIYSINRFIRVEARLPLIFSTSGNASSMETRPIPNVGAAMGSLLL